MIEPMKLIGAAGLLLISGGIVMRNRQHADVLYILGGIGLEAYSIYIGDMVFIILQIVFTLSASYDYFKQIRISRSPL